MAKLFFDVRKLRRDGVLIARWQIYEGQPFRGNLYIRDVLYGDLGRTTRTATIVDARYKPVAGLLPLSDATLIYAKDDIMCITGFERVDHLGVGDFGAPRDYAQTWLLIPIAPPSEEPAELLTPPPQTSTKRHV